MFAVLISRLSCGNVINTLNPYQTVTSLFWKWLARLDLHESKSGHRLNCDLVDWEYQSIVSRRITSFPQKAPWPFLWVTFFGFLSMRQCFPKKQLEIVRIHVIWSKHLTNCCQKCWQKCVNSWKVGRRTSLKPSPQQITDLSDPEKQIFLQFAH